MDTDKSEIGSIGLLTDEPISDPAQDKLNRNSFAVNLAESLLSYESPSCLTLAIYGRWGSGKTSLMNLIEKHLRWACQDSKKVVLRFNPWNISSLDQLIMLFFRELKIAIAGEGKLEKWRLRASTLFEVLGGVLAVGQLSPIGNQYFAAGANVSKEIGKAISTTRRKPLEAIKDELNKLLSENLDRIFIFIDDIDRLDKDAMKLLFRMIRLNANFEKTTYVLAFDNTVVEETLNEEQPSYGREYLGKIVQLPINVPDIDSAALREILGSELDRFLNSQDKINFDERHWNELAATGRFFELFGNIRDVARYVNGLKVLYKNVHNEVNVVDFMGLEAIRLLHPDYYDFIRHNKPLFTHLQTSSALYQEDIEGARTILKSKFGLGQLQEGESIEEKRRGNLVWDVCKCLFPHLERVERNFNFGPGFSQTWHKEKRICSDEMFDKYFIIGIPRGDISAQEMASVMSKSGESLSEELKGLSDRNLLRRFFELAEEYVDQVNPSNVKVIITALFDVEDKIISERSISLRPPLYFYVASLIVELLLRIESVEERKRTILGVINGTDKLFSPVYFIHHITPIEERQSDSAEKDLQKLGFSLDDVKEFQAACTVKIKKCAETGELAQAPHVDLLMHKWRDWGVKDEVNRFVQQLLETKEGILALLVGFAGERIGTDGRQVLVNKKNLGEFTDIDAFENKVKNLDKSKLNEPQKELLDSFLRGEDLLS
jgi:predicted KAP-like P-loop ATPase